MKDERIKKLKEFIEKDPDDPFNLYALALEYQNYHPNLALSCFDQLLAKHPNYLPTYYHAAQAHLDNDDRNLAEVIYKNGIELAKKLKDTHTLRELQNAYNNFLFEDD